MAIDAVFIHSAGLKHIQLKDSLSAPVGAPAVERIYLAIK